MFMQSSSHCSFRAQALISQLRANNMKKTLLCSALLAALMSVAGGAQAALVGRDINGNAVAGNDAGSVFLYDTVLNVTWLRDANSAQTSGYASYGRMSWATATDWVANLTVGSYSDWRLPTMIDTGSSGCNYANGGTDCGYNVQTASGGTVYSEMASLWYDTLGNTAGSLTNSGDFQNLQSYYYWFGLQYAPSPSYSWVFNATDGLQYVGANTELNALAVRSGDVSGTSSATPSAVPIPAAAWLMASGLGALGVAARKRRAKAA
jgi:hypothetical protein